MYVPLFSTEVNRLRGTQREELRKEARNLENEIDYKLIAFSKVAASLKDDEYSFSTDKEALLGSVNKTLAQM